MSIRIQLLLVALTTLVLPWAGCQYAHDLAAALRASQEQALLASAGTIANALAAQPERIFGDHGTAPFSAAAGDVYVHALPSTAHAGDWPAGVQFERLATAAPLAAKVAANATDHDLYLFLEVASPRLAFEPEDVHPLTDRFDRVALGLAAPDGRIREVFFAARQPGMLSAQHVLIGQDGIDRAALDGDLIGVWTAQAGGYRLAVRIPRALLAAHLRITVSDGPADDAATGSGGRLFFARPGLDALLASFVRTGTAVSVVDGDGLRLGSAGQVDAAAPQAALSLAYRHWLDAQSDAAPRLTRGGDHIIADAVLAALGGLPQVQWVRTQESAPILLAAAPLLIDDRAHGAVVLEQAATQLDATRNRATVRLFGLTLLATSLAVLATLLMAARLSLRLGRLTAAADAAVAESAQRAMPESGAHDEIGALARAFERMLARLHEHTLYLRTLGGKLSHELRTPLSIVRSSLDNLEATSLPADAQIFAARAREGVQRQTLILNALGAAARVEHSISDSERVNFDLAQLLQTALDAYRDAFAGARFALALPVGPCPLRGSPELIVQMLDKLIDNAVDFLQPGGVISVALTRARSDYELRVGNDGVLLPPGLPERLFESLYEQRSGQDGKAHFGLGLYIVRLVAQFHGGSVAAANRADGSGVQFTVSLPMI